MEVKTISNDEMLVSLLSQLAQIQAQLAAIISTRFDRQTSQNVQNKVENKRSYVVSQAERYGQPQEKAEPAISSYQEGLEDVRSEYSTEKNLWLAQSGEFEQEEFDRTIEIRKLQKEVQELRQQKAQESKTNGQQQPKKQTISIEEYEKKLNEYKQRMRESRQSSKQSKDNVKDCQHRCNTKINEVSEDKSLVAVEDKKNIFQQLFSKIKDKIGGKEKFKNNVIEPLKAKATYIKEEIVPKVKEEIQQNVMPKLKELFERGKEKVKELNLPEKFKNLMSMAKEGAKTVISKCSGFKDVAVSAFQKGVSLAREGISKVTEKVSDLMDR